MIPESQEVWVHGAPGTGQINKIGEGRGGGKGREGKGRSNWARGAASSCACESDTARGLLLISVLVRVNTTTSATTQPTSHPTTIPSTDAAAADAFAATADAFAASADDRGSVGGGFEGAVALADGW